MRGFHIIIVHFKTEAFKYTGVKIRKVLYDNRQMLPNFLRLGSRKKTLNSTII